MVKPLSCMVSCFVPISSITFTPPIVMSPDTWTLPVIEPPVSSNLLSKAFCNPDVFAMVESPSLIVPNLPFISVKRLVVPTKKELAWILTPEISPVVEKSPCCVISPKKIVPTNVVLPWATGNDN